MTVVVDNRIRVPLAEVRDVAELQSRFEHANPDIESDPGAPEWIVTHKREGESLTLPRGGMARLRRHLEPGFQVDDQTTWRHPVADFPDHAVSARDYQVAMIDAAERERTCLLRAPTGSGKTSAALGLLARLKRRALVVVWTGNLERQWRERCASELGYAESDVGQIRGDRHFVAPVTVAMQQTIVRRLERGDRELAEAFDVLVCDEIQRFAAPTLYRTVDPFRTRYRVGVSADETRKDGKEFLVYDLFGDVAASVDEASLIESGAVVEVELLVVPTAFEARWYRYRQDFNRLLAQMTADEARNAQLLDVVGRMVRQGHQVLVFTHRVEHARSIDQRLTEMGIRSGTLLGGVDNELAFERTRAGLRDGTRRVGVGTYQAIAQGTDIPTVDRGVCATPIANNRQQLGQVRGRICRPSGGKQVGKLLVMWDRAIYGRKLVENLVRWHRVVRVLDGRQWVDGGEYLAARR